MIKLINIVKIIFFIYPILVFSQEINKKISLNMLFEKCNTDSISLCGNYFYQDRMRNPLLIKEEYKKDFLSRYDTIYELSLEDVLKIETVGKEKKYVYNILFTDKFFSNIKKSLRKNKFIEKPTKQFSYYKFFIEAEVERLGEENIYVLNPFAKNIDDLFLEKKTVKFLITKLISYK